MLSNVYHPLPTNSMRGKKRKRKETIVKIVATTYQKNCEHSLDLVNKYIDENIMIEIDDVVHALQFWYNF